MRESLWMDHGFGVEHEHNTQLNSNRHDGGWGEASNQDEAGGVQGNVPAPPAVRTDMNSAWREATQHRESPGSAVGDTVGLLYLMWRCRRTVVCGTTL